MAVSPNENNAQPSDSLWKFHINKYVCEFIKEQWFADGGSNDALAVKFQVHDSIVAKIRSGEDYNIPMHTLSKICYYKEMKVSDFFLLLEQKYGDLLYQDYFPVK